MPSFSRSYIYFFFYFLGNLRSEEGRGNEEKSKLAVLDLHSQIPATYSSVKEMNSFTCTLLWPAATELQLPFFLSNAAFVLVLLLKLNIIKTKLLRNIEGLIKKNGCIVKISKMWESSLKNEEINTLYILVLPIFCQRVMYYISANWVKVPWWYATLVKWNVKNFKGYG